MLFKDFKGDFLFAPFAAYAQAYASTASRYWKHDLAQRVTIDAIAK